MPCRDAYRANAPFTKFVPLSVMMLLGTPYRHTKSATKRTAVGPSSFLIGRASIHLVNLSTATRRCVMPLLALLNGSPCPVPILQTAMRLESFSVLMLVDDFLL